MNSGAHALAPAGRQAIKLKRILRQAEQATLPAKETLASCRRRLLAALCVSPWLLAACGRDPAPTPAGPPLRVGAYYWPGMHWVDIAHKQGWFREAGVNVEWVNTNADYFASFDDLAHGKLDVVGFTFYDLLLQRARGRPFVGFLASDISAGAEALIARPGIAGIADLKGKRLGLPKGTYIEFMWTTLSARAGLSPGAVTLVEVAAEKAAEALKAGRVDAVFTWEPVASAALAAVKGTKLFDSSQLPGIAWVVYATRGDLLKRREADFHKFVAVWQRVDAFMRSRPDEANALVAEVNRTLPADVAAFARLDHALDLKENRAAFSFVSGFGSLHGVGRMMIDFQLRHGLIDKQIDTTELLDPHFVEALRLNPAESSTR